MKLHVALFFAGLFGALATLFILLSFGTDYWLLASQTCESHSNGPVTLEVGVVLVLLGQKEKLAWMRILLIWILVLGHYKKTFRDGWLFNKSEMPLFWTICFCMFWILVCLLFIETQLNYISALWSLLKILKQSWAYLVSKQWQSYDILVRQYLQSQCSLSVDYHMLQSDTTFNIK